MPIDNRNINNEDSVYIDDTANYNREAKPVPAPGREIGIDTKQAIFDNIVNAGISGQVDMSQIDAFTKISASRDEVYGLLDTMCQDSIISSVIETYAEDATECNDQGQIVWCESSDANVQSYVSFLLDTMNVDKHIYRWVHSLCKYGDVYLRLYRESDVEDDDLFSSNNSKKVRGRKKLHEDVKIKYYGQNDHYINYLEMYHNPAEIFELTKFGKTYAYIKAPVGQSKSSMNAKALGSIASLPSYNFNKGDIDLHGPTDFVHASLEDNSSRTPEIVTILKSETDSNKNPNSYTVKRGQSLLYNTFSSWRELQLLENSVLLNRLTKSSIVRIVGVEVGDMPKENIAQHLLGIKGMIEQKTALRAGGGMSEYTNPGPIENNIYVPTHDGKGNITAQTIGGDVDVKSLADLSYYQDKLFGSMRVPKQFFGVTDEGGGFSGGQSLSIISSRYGKMVKRIQNTIIQALTDAINLLLLDRGLTTYVNNFTIRMQAPTTQEEVDRRENLSSKVGLTRDVMDMLSEIQTPETKLKILKSLLSNTISNTEVTNLIQEEIDKLENPEETPPEETSTNEEDTFSDFDTSDSTGDDFSLDSFEATDIMSSPDTESTEVVSPISDEGEDNYLPTPDELGQDMTKFEG